MVPQETYGTVRIQTVKYCRVQHVHCMVPTNCSLQKMNMSWIMQTFAVALLSAQSPQFMDVQTHTVLHSPHVGTIRCHAVSCRHMHFGHGQYCSLCEWTCRTMNFSPKTLSFNLTSFYRIFSRTAWNADAVLRWAFCLSVRPSVCLWMNL